MSGWQGPAVLNHLGMGEWRGVYGYFSEECHDAEHGEAEEAKGAIAAAEGPQADPKALSALGIAGKTFGLVSLGEWGDRTQITAVMLAASHPALGVACGALSGFFLGIGLAMVAGRRVAGRLSERFIPRFAGALLLVFAIAAISRGMA